LTRVLCLNVYRLYVPNIMILCFKKIAPLKVGPFAWYGVKICVIFNVHFERRTVDKKQPTRKL